MFILYMGESGSFLLVVDPAEHREKGKTWGAIRVDDLSEDYGENALYPISNGFASFSSFT